VTNNGPWISQRSVGHLSGLAGCKNYRPSHRRLPPTARRSIHVLSCTSVVQVMELNFQNRLTTPIYGSSLQLRGLCRIRGSTLRLDFLEPLTTTSTYGLSAE